MRVSVCLLEESRSPRRPCTPCATHHPRLGFSYIAPFTVGPSTCRTSSTSSTLDQLAHLMTHSPPHPLHTPLPPCPPSPLSLLIDPCSATQPPHPLRPIPPCMHTPSSGAMVNSHRSFGSQLLTIPSSSPFPTWPSRYPFIAFQYGSPFSPSASCSSCLTACVSTGSSGGSGFGRGKGWYEADMAW